MMDWGLILTLLSTFLSFYGTYLSFKQYRKAKNIADVIQNRKISLDLMDFFNNQLLPFERMCISNTTNVRGRNAEKFVLKLQNVLSTLNIIKSKIHEKNKERLELDTCYSYLHSYINALKRNNDTAYSKTLEQVRSLITIISSIINKTVYKND